MLIRAEEPGDVAAVNDVHQAAFGGAHGLVVAAMLSDLRSSLPAEPGLSLVALDCVGAVAGHVLFTHNLLDAPRRLVAVQVLSPVAVRPDLQRQGIGTALVSRGLSVLADRGVPAVFLEGSPDYYSRFGFAAAGELGFRRPSLRIPAAGFQVRLLPAYEPWMTGTLVYRREFWDHDCVGLRADAESA